ncbi:MULTISPECIES: GTPase [unclassified Acinetobacter]|uniref:GTPase n=1 Tax=unclassified Acinetobacter TaxID=196816 RepID=UPI00190B99B0|nr:MULTISPECIES: GTPase [unclassified Acinetobacter]MBK0065052.1 50S ribosome-binding GTPase [Acinetobacter sp. S55]MBK0068234.1 50S ribosome-binding GTPase [Acinetobacter sp. S54]
MDMQNFDGVVNAILAVIPNRETDLARLRRLIMAGTYPTITVIGKYNHGKSRLLNELIGHDIFSVADKRETLHLAEHIHQNISWLDAPGLDADVAAVDDDYAFNAIWTQADIRLFVHSIREGELDAIEHQLLQQLVHDFQSSRRQTLLVLTQIDQMPDQQVLAHIQQSIAHQIPDLNALSVSATRHRQGIEKSKPLLVEKSGIVALQQALEFAISQVPTAREHEKLQLFKDMQQQLNQLQVDQEHLQQKLQQTQQQQRQDFDEGLIKVLDKIREDLHPILDISGQDEALVPDSFATMFKNTVGKQQRAKVQIAYSRACIDMNSHLIRHGVVGLPEDQQTHVKSLDTVIVAVLGISVKFREHLHTLFFTDAERQRLQREFAFYFEKSAGREALVEQLNKIEKQLHDIAQAQTALKMLEDAV